MQQSQSNSARSEGLSLLSSTGEQRTFLEAQMLESCVKNIKVPKHLQQDLKNNPHMVKEFYSGVVRAVWGTLSDPKTAPRFLSETAISERIEACYDIMVHMRKEGHRPLVECFGALKMMLTDRLVLQQHRDDLLKDRQRDTTPLDGETQVAMDDVLDSPEVSCVG